MIAQTYTLRDVSRQIRENANSERYRFCQEITKDVADEFKESIFPPVLRKCEMDVTGHDLLLTFQVDEADARFLEISLHNLYLAKLLH